MIHSTYRKYGNKKIVVDGIQFDSQKEARRYSELKILEKQGVIEDLELQKKYVLIPAQKDENGKVIERACNYIADFVYFDNEKRKVVVEDVKGYRDTSSAGYAKFVIKRKLMRYLFNVAVEEV